MLHPLQKEVLKVYKALHRARKIVFEGDIRALEAGRIKINEEFKKNKHVSNKDAIDELVKLAREVEKELKANVIQAEQVEPGKYQVKIKPDTTKLDNVPYRDCGKT